VSSLAPPLSLEEIRQERGEEKNKRARPCGLALSLQRYGSLYLSATNGNRVPETVIKVKRKPANGLKHIGRNSMPRSRMSQELVEGKLGEPGISPAYKNRLAIFIDSQPESFSNQ
jgi:hypothetical protein